MIIIWWVIMKKGKQDVYFAWLDLDGEPEVRGLGKNPCASKFKA